MPSVPLSVTVRIEEILLKPPSGRLIIGDEGTAVLKPQNVTELEKRNGKKRLAVEVPKEYSVSKELDVNLDKCTIRDRENVVYVRLDFLFSDI